jgi:hypothetical protein
MMYELAVWTLVIGAAPLALALTGLARERVSARSQAPSARMAASRARLGQVERIANPPYMRSAGPARLDHGGRIVNPPYFWHVENSTPAFADRAHRGGSMCCAPRNLTLPPFQSRPPLRGGVPSRRDGLPSRGATAGSRNAPLHTRSGLALDPPWPPLSKGGE